jgi:hypothetical protein
METDMAFAFFAAAATALFAAILAALAQARPRARPIPVRITDRQPPRR